MILREDGKRFYYAKNFSQTIYLVRIEISGQKLKRTKGEISWKNKEMYTKQEVVEMLKDMQRETGECVGFFVGQVSQLWVIKDLIEKRLNDMGETGY